MRNSAVFLPATNQIKQLIIISLLRAFLENCDQAIYDRHLFQTVAYLMAKVDVIRTGGGIPSIFEAY